jgi:hypothetical protein
MKMKIKLEVKIRMKIKSESVNMSVKLLLGPLFWLIYTQLALLEVRQNTNERTNFKNLKTEH